MQSPETSNTPWSAGHGLGLGEKSDFYTVEIQNTKHAQWINFVFASGTQRSFALLNCREMSFRADEGIRLIFRETVIHIIGRNLAKLYQHLLARKVKEVREFGQKLEYELEESELIITAIEIQGDQVIH